MTAPTTDLELRPFEPGTTGWTADDLDDPDIDRLWQMGRYEIVEGVLAARPTYDLDTGFAVMRFSWIVQKHVDGHGIGGNFALSADYILGSARVAQCDVVFMM